MFTAIGLMLTGIALGFALRSFQWPELLGRAISPTIMLMLFALGVAVAFIVIVAAKWDGGRVRPAGVTAWVVTVVIGLSVWGLRNAAVPHWSFILVATIMSGLLLLGWRLIAGRRSGRTNAAAPGVRETTA